MLYWLNSIPNSNQGLVLLIQTQILRSTRHRNLRKQNNEDFFIPLLNPWLHFINNKFTIPTHIEEVLEEPVILNPHMKLNFSSNNPYFDCIPLKNVTNEFTIIRELCRFFQLGLIYYTRFEEKPGHNSQWLETQN